MKKEKYIIHSTGKTQMGLKVNAILRIFLIESFQYFLLLHMPVIHCTGSSSHTSGSTRSQPRVNRNKKHSRRQASSGSGPGSTRILLAYSAAYGAPRESTMRKYLIVLIWIPVHRALCGSGPRQDPRRVITPLRLMDPGVRLTPGGSPCMPHSRSRALG